MTSEFEIRRAPGRFWDWSLNVYQEPEVCKACLRLQDDCGLDVNMLLFCCWTAAIGFAPLNPDLIQAARDLSRRWSLPVTDHLRAARRALKTPMDEAPAELAETLRAGILELELDAERVQQDMLEDLIQLNGEPAAEDHAPSEIVQENLRAYVAVTGTRLGHSHRRALDHLIAIV